MDLQAVEVPSGSWGVDLNSKLTVQSAVALSKAPLYAHQVRFVWRYAPLPDNNPHGDIDAAELEAITDAGMIAIIVQHCRSGLWTAFGTRGGRDGQVAAEHAKSVGYPDGCCIALDLEAVANVGADVISHCNEWTAAVSSAGYRAVIYVGFSCGLSPDQLYHDLTADRYWSDFGPRAVSVRGFCCKQYQQIQLAGLEVDPDHAFVDAQGGNLIGAARSEPITSVT